MIRDTETQLTDLRTITSVMRRRIANLEARVAALQNVAENHHDSYIHILESLDTMHERIDQLEG